MKTNVSELNMVIREMNELSSKPNPSKREERRLSTLMVFAKAMQNGASLAELEQEAHNEESRAAGLPETNFRTTLLSREKEAEVRGWMKAVHESRDMNVGNPISQLGTYTGLGSFVPTDFYPHFFQDLKHVDALFDENAVTYIQSSNGRPLPIPMLSDTENIATPVGEGSLLTEQDIALTAHLTLGAYNFKTPMFITSIEAFQDVETAATTLDLFKDFSKSRFARGAGKYLVGGSGVGQPNGLLNQLTALNAPTVVAAGQSGNDGGVNTGANSIGTDDIANMIQKLDPLYLASPKCAFMMNMAVFTQLLRVKDKVGRPLIDFTNGARTLFGFPIKICPNLPNIASGTQGTIVLGDWSYWATRVSYGEGDGVQVFKERYAELGKVGMRLFARVDGGVIWSGDTNSTCPFVLLQQHS